MSGSHSDAGRASEDGNGSAGAGGGGPLLEVEGLTKHYPITEGVLRREVGRVWAVDGVSFAVRPGETFGLIGETGCGKSTTARTLLRLEEPTAGTVRFDGADVTGYDDAGLKRFRRRTGMIFQDPTSSFDPRMSIGESIAEPLEIHGMRDADRRRSIAGDLLERVGLAAEAYDRYPHELSGGQKQRAALARALVLNPDLLVADEPVSALDVSVQAEILALLEDLQAAFDLSVLLITHDMGVVREVCDRVAVMYLGEIVERGPTEAVFESPQHPYTRALVASIPTADPRAGPREVELKGDVPDASNPPAGCRFHPRCPAVIQPDGYDFEQGTWRRVMDLRVALADGTLDPDALCDDGGASPQGAVREEYGLPGELDDPDAEAVLAAALDEIAAGDLAAADERLRSAFATVCERENPDLLETDADHPAACHLHAEEAAADAPD